MKNLDRKVTLLCPLGVIHGSGLILKCIIGNIKAKRMETRITRVFFKYALREKRLGKE